MTEPAATDKQIPKAVREIVRRAGHELRNALSGIAVNVEVVRSRSERNAPASDVTSFAERARLQVAVATELANGLISLISSVLTASSEGTLRSIPTSDAGAESQIELMIYGERAASTLSDIERLAKVIDVEVELTGQRVILTVLPEGKSHSKV